MKADRFAPPAWLARVSALEDRAQALAERRLETTDPAARALLWQQSQFARGIAKSIRDQVCRASLAAMKAQPMPRPEPVRDYSGPALIVAGLALLALCVAGVAMHLAAFAK